MPDKARQNIDGFQTVLKLVGTGANGEPLYALGVQSVDSAGNTVNASGATPTVTSVPSAAASTPLKAANASRVGAIIANDSTSILYVLFGAGTASAANYTFAIPAKGTVAADRTVTGYTGALTGFWPSANGAALVTEVA